MMSYLSLASVAIGALAFAVVVILLGLQPRVRDDE
jgi:hypothetical protein